MEIAAGVVALLSPFLAQAAGAIAARAGEVAAAQLADLYRLVRRRFDDGPDSAARDALRSLEEKPGDALSQKALVGVLAARVTTDQEFARELTDAVGRITHGERVSQQFLTQVFGGEVGKIININEAEQVYID